MLFPLGRTAKQARAEGEEVPDNVPDCAELYCEGWALDPLEPFSSVEGFKATFRAVRPCWRWLHISIVEKKDSDT